MKHPWPRLPLTYRNFIRAIVLSTSLSSTAYALDLGEMQVTCEPDEPFRATIRIIDLPPSSSGISVGLATRAEFSEAIIEITPEVRELEFTAIKKMDGEHYIIVSSDEPMDDESIHFLLAIEDSNSRVLREYIVIEEDDVYSAHAQPSLIELTREDEDEPEVKLPLPYIAMGSEPEIFEEEPEGEPVRVEQRREHRVVESTQVYRQGQYRVQAGENLWEIAEEVQEANPDASFYQVLAALYETNSSAFIDNDINKLRTGANLNIPSASVLEEVDPQSVRDVKARMGYAAQPVQSVEKEDMPEVLEEISEEATEASVTLEAELKILTPKEVGEMMGHGEDSEEASDSLVLANEELLQAQRENEDLMMRMQALQNQVNTLQEMLNVREGNVSGSGAEYIEEINEEPVSDTVNMQDMHADMLRQHSQGAEATPGLAVEHTGVMSNSNLWNSLTSNQWFNYLALGIGAIILLLVSLALFRQNRRSQPMQKPVPKSTPFSSTKPPMKKPVMSAGNNHGNNGHNAHSAKVATHPPKKMEEAAKHSAPSKAGAGEEDKIEAKLKLARAYHDLGDDDNAITLLQEVLWEGDTRQRKMAKEWLDRIDEEKKA